MAYTDIRYEIDDDGVATVTLDRPENRNAMSLNLMAEVMDALGRADRDRSVRVVIVTGAGDGAFCAGGDLRVLGDGDRAADAGPPTAYQRRAWLKHNQQMILAVRATEKPVLAAVNGVAVGGGCDLALACDLRFASDRARFGEVFSKIGLFPGTGGTYLLPRVVGVAKALELIWTGDVIDAAEAERIGLVTAVVPHEQLMSTVEAFAGRLAAGPPLALSLAKSAVYRGLDLDIAAAFDYAATAEAITLTSEDHTEGLAAFRERRTPTYRGR